VISPYQREYAGRDKPEKKILGEKGGVRKKMVEKNYCRQGKVGPFV